MKDKLFSAIAGQKADYIEIRLDESNSSRLTFRGDRLEEAGRSASTGGNVRALVRGGWGFVTFNSLDSLADKVALAVEQAGYAGKEDSKFSPVPPVKDTVAAESKKNPLKISLSDKKDILDEYNRLMLGTPEVQTTSIGYTDTQKKVTLVTSEGTLSSRAA